MSELQAELSGSVVRGIDNIAKLAQDWDGLFARADDAPAYLSRAWAETFITERRIRGVPLLITVTHGPKLVAILALSIRRFLGIRIAECIGTQEPSYLGILIDPEFPAAVHTVADVLKVEKVAHILYNKYLSSLDESTNRLISALKQRGFFCKLGHRRYSYWIKLQGSFDEYLLKNKSSKSRQTIKRKERKLQNAGQIELEYHSGNGVTQHIINRIAAIQRASWMRKKGAVKLSELFRQKLLLNMAKAGLGRIWLLRINNDDAAFVYAYAAHGKLNYAWTAFKLKFKDFGSIGMVLTGWTIKKACEDSINSYDFGFGGSEYKEFWSTDFLDIHRAALGQGILGICAVYCYNAIWWTARSKWLFSFYLKFRKWLNLIKQELHPVFFPSKAR